MLELAEVMVRRGDLGRPTDEVSSSSRGVGRLPPLPSLLEKELPKLEPFLSGDSGREGNILLSRRLPRTVPNRFSPLIPDLSFFSGSDRSWTTNVKSA